MLRRFCLHLAGAWYDAWADRAELMARRWGRRGARWRTLSEKFFNRVGR